MAKALVLPLLETEAGPWLAAIRQVADPRSRSEPHVTIRYPIKRIDSRYIESSRDARITSVEVSEAGSFKNRRGDHSVIYLACASEILQSFNYKPMFPDSVFHITIFEGQTSEFTENLLTLLEDRPWHLSIQFHEPTAFDAIDIGKNAARQRRSERFSDATLAILRELGYRADERDLEQLSDSERLSIIDMLVERLHAILRSRTDIPEPVPLERTVPAVDGVEQQALWTGAPVPIPGSAREIYSLSGDAAKGGGLVPTPPELVEQMVRSALQVHKDRPIDFGDPAFGSGIFLAVLARLVKDPSRLRSASAVEIDEHRAAAAASRWRERHLRLLVGDFLSAEPTLEWNFVLANPPYVRSQDLGDAIKEHARHQIRQHLGLTVPRRANMYVYFLLLAHAWMAPGATAAWLLPADFMETAYASVLREYLSSHVTLTHVHAFDPNDLRFEIVKVSPAIIVFQKVRPLARGHKVTLSRGGSIQNPTSRSRWSSSELLGEKNWRVLAEGAGGGASPQSADDLSIGALMRVRRGVATGANRFFVLNEDQVADLQIERRFLRPLLPRPRFMPKSGVVPSDTNGEPLVQPRLFLIDASEPLSQLDRTAPNLAAYLRSAPKEVLDAHLVSKRSVFYRQESRAVAQVVASTMGRFEEGAVPVRYFLNLSRATVLNNYHCLYPRNGGELEADDARFVVEILRRVDPAEYRRCGREYADGLYKLEPAGLSKIRLSVSKTDAERLRELLV